MYRTRWFFVLLVTIAAPSLFVLTFATFVGTISVVAMLPTSANWSVFWSRLPGSLIGWIAMSITPLGFYALTQIYYLISVTLRDGVAAIDRSRNVVWRGAITGAIPMSFGVLGFGPLAIFSGSLMGISLSGIPLLPLVAFLIIRVATVHRRRRGSNAVSD